MSRLGHTASCRCGDCGIEATRRHIAEMECEMKLCGHWTGDRWASADALREHNGNLRPPDPRARPAKVWR